MPRPLRPAPLSIRLSQAERASLERRAGGVGLSTYAKSVLFADSPSRDKSRRRSADQVLLAQILGQLGAGGLSSHLKTLSAAADGGSLDLDDLTVSRLRDACHDIRGIHLLLMQALGKKLPAGNANKERVSVHFVRAAIDAGSKQ